jgi:ACS family tartrate transporter-like MFS transporter
MTNISTAAPSADSPLDRARKKAYWRLIPILFACYVIAYVDRANVAIAKLTMSVDMPAFDNAVIGFGAGVFFWGYFLLEVPGSLIVEKWGARLWICRIMVTWGILAALTGFVQSRIPGFTHVAEFMLRGLVAALRGLLAVTDWTWVRDSVAQFEGASGLAIFQFYLVRFCLGLAEAGFFPGIIVFLTHWFPVRDRTRALALFFVATPVAQLISPQVSKMLLKIGTDEVINGVRVHHPEVLGLVGWQWVYIFWGIPAVALGAVVLFWLKDRPAQAKWLTPEERDALEQQLAIDKAVGGKKRMGILQALRHPMVLALCFVYFCSVTGNYGIEFFLPSILQKWYSLKIADIAWLVMLPPIVAMLSQLFVGWNSDRVQERRWHAIVPMVAAMVAFAVVPLTKGNLFLTIFCFMVVGAGVKAYLPAFWALPNMFLTGAAAAGSIGLINSVGNLGGFFGPSIVGYLEKKTGSFVWGLYYLGLSAGVAALVLFVIGIGRKDNAPVAAAGSRSSTPIKA